MKRLASVAAIPAVLALLCATACKDPAEDPYDGPDVGLLDDAGLFPYPSIHLMVEDEGTATGWRLALSADALPRPDGGSPVDVERLHRLDGFSPANTAVVLLPDADIDPGSLPPAADPSASLSSTAAVQLIDLDAGVRVPCFAELDAHPDTTGPENRVLLIRPLQAMAFATHHAVVLTSALRDRSGAPVTAPERFAALRDGGEIHPGLASLEGHYADLLDRLEELDVPRSEMVLAWDFWTASEAAAHAPLDVVLEATRADLPADPASSPAYTVDWVSDTDEGYILNEHAWRLAEGSFELLTFLGDDRVFDLDAGALPVPQDRDDDVYFQALVPASLHDAAAGSAPVLIFGHGIFAQPYSYIGDQEDPQSVIELADRLGAIVVGTTWRGLTTDDLPDAIQVANDFGQFPLITDKMIQGVANALALPRLMRTGFADAAFLQASDGQGSLVDPTRIYYYGISLGGIEGATLMANVTDAEDIDYAVLHVGGSMWSTMLERSSNWPTFEQLLQYSMPDPVDRQVSYAVSQLLWDPVDPIDHAGDLAGRSILWQESMGDEQVPNLTTEAMARSVGVPLLVPAVEPPQGLTPLEAPLGPGAAALMQFDPGLGRPVDENRPAPVTGAHGYIRHTEEVMSQIEAFFTAGAEGTIIHPCGDDPCVFDGS